MSVPGPDGEMGVLSPTSKKEKNTEYRGGGLRTRGRVFLWKMRGKRVASIYPSAREGHLLDAELSSSRKKDIHEPDLAWPATYLSAWCHEGGIRCRGVDGVGVCRYMYLSNACVCTVSRESQDSLPERVRRPVDGPNMRAAPEGGPNPLAYHVRRYNGERRLLPRPRVLFRRHLSPRFHGPHALRGCALRKSDTYTSCQGPLHG